MVFAYIFSILTKTQNWQLLFQFLKNSIKENFCLQIIKLTLLHTTKYMLLIVQVKTLLLIIYYMICESVTMYIYTVLLLSKVQSAEYRCGQTLCYLVLTILYFKKCHLNHLIEYLFLPFGSMVYISHLFRHFLRSQLFYTVFCELLSSYSHASMCAGLNTQKQFKGFKCGLSEGTDAWLI